MKPKVASYGSLKLKIFSFTYIDVEHFLCFDKAKMAIWLFSFTVMSALIYDLKTKHRIYDLQLIITTKHNIWFTQKITSDWSIILIKQQLKQKKKKKIST